MEDLVNKFNPYLQDRVFIEVLDLVKQNSKGKIWIIGGFLYRNLANALYGGETYNYDIDFIVEEKNDNLKEVTGWEIHLNNYGNKNYVREKNRMSFTDMKKIIRVSGIRVMTIFDYLKETPFDIQSIAYDLEENEIIGEKGIQALNKTIKINSKEQADFYVKAKNRDLKDVISEKSKELNFGYEI